MDMVLIGQKRKIKKCDDSRCAIIYIAAGLEMQ